MPAACKKAVTNIITMQTGASHLVKTTYNPFKRNGAVSCTSSMMLLGFKKNPIKIQVHKATIGIRMLLVRKSKGIQNGFSEDLNAIPNTKAQR